VAARDAPAERGRVRAPAVQEEHAAAALRDLETSFAAFPEAVAGHALPCFLRFGPLDRAVRSPSSTPEPAPSARRAPASR
jgi:hypothetical protein